MSLAHLLICGLMQEKTHSCRDKNSLNVIGHVHANGRTVSFTHQASRENFVGQAMGPT